jgi:hypothetical protein
MNVSTQKEIAAPPKCKSGGSQHLRRAPARCDIIFEMYGREENKKDPKGFENL